MYRHSGPTKWAFISLLWQFPPNKAQDRQKQPKQACSLFCGLAERQVTSPDWSNVWLVAWKKAVVTHPVPFYKVERFSTWNARSNSKEKVERSGKDAGHSRQPHAAAYAHSPLQTIKKNKRLAFRKTCYVDTGPEDVLHASPSIKLLLRFLSSFSNVTAVAILFIACESMWIS